MFRPAKCGIDHHSLGHANRVSDRIFFNSVVMMPAYSTVFDPLTLLVELGSKLSQVVYSIVSAVVLDKYSDRCGFLFELKLSLYGFISCESYLVNHGYLFTGCITEDSSTSLLLRIHRVSSC